MVKNKLPPRSGFRLQFSGERKLKSKLLFFFNSFRDSSNAMPLLSDVFITFSELCQIYLKKVGPNFFYVQDLVKGI